ncbi:PHB depolymerase family esterase [Actinomadura kijaniata]|uniref:Polyhydroxybutyrate depolymerase n=1 Tax=Actinomadura namibiensis TaxID=182080 RepID=A0A7W3QKM8_ACTNM|nr:PHB depolymerase family esterase [Actinomadura namibiensis]MBA8950699.1 polyhydroxybutyrate depolymerase [Actinomadura namibiensis]
MRLVLGVLAVGVALGGCSSGTPDPPRRASPSPVSPSPVADASDGCGRRSPGTGRHAFGGRPYALTLPPYDGRTPVPLVLDLHGLNSNAFQQALYGRMASAGPQRGFAVVQPEAARGRGGWKLPGMTGGDADVAYVGRLLDHLEGTLCVDRRRVFATGFSNGAGLSAALVCGLRGRLAAVAPVAGLNLARPCAGARPTTIVAFHGTGDPVVPYGGGEPFGGDRARIPAWMRPVDGVFALPPVPAVAGQWARTFGCGPGERSTVGGEVRRVRYAGCRDGVRVELHTVAGGGHSWPGSFSIGAGAATARVDATRLALDAFAGTR